MERSSNDTSQQRLVNLQREINVAALQVLRQGTEQRKGQFSPLFSNGWGGGGLISCTSDLFLEISILLLKSVNENPVCVRLDPNTFQGNVPVPAPCMSLTSASMSLPHLFHYEGRGGFPCGL